jgi:CDP-diacylglycerol--glycerol-3-phosphate 3-phosphatidyltransferase
MLRLLSIPTLFFIYNTSSPNSNIISAIIFLMGAITDWLDGFLARYFRQRSILGAFLDPVADKLMVVTALILLMALYNHLLITIPAVIIICREIIISALRILVSHSNRNAVLKVAYIGKIKTFFQMAAIFFLLLRSPILNCISIFIGCVLLYIAVLLTLYSMFVYLYFAHKLLHSK